MIDRLMSLIVAVSLALLVWLYARSREEMVRYVAECEKLTAQKFYAVPPNGDLASKLENLVGTVTWRSPIDTNFAANNIARADFFNCERGRRAPAVRVCPARSDRREYV